MKKPPPAQQELPVHLGKGKRQRGFFYSMETTKKDHRIKERENAGRANPTHLGRSTGQAGSQRTWYSNWDLKNGAQWDRGVSQHGPVDISDWAVFCGGGLACEMISSILVHLLPAGSTFPQAVTTKQILRHCHMFCRGENWPKLRTRGRSAGNWLGRVESERGLQGEAALGTKACK